MSDCARITLVTTVTPEPTPRPVPTEKPVGFGILATGKIARTFAADLALVPDARLVAVGSRSRESAEAFVEQVGLPDVAAHGSYAELVADPRVEVVYVASPHSHHLEHVRLALEAGTHVLCEKPVTLRLADAEAMVDLAAQHDRFLMEAMWTATHPVIRAVVEGLAAGRFGTPRHLHAELGFRVDAPPSGPDARPGARCRRPARHGHLTRSPWPTCCSARRVAAGERDPLRARHRPRRRAGGPLPRWALATMTASLTSWSSRTATIATDGGRIEPRRLPHPHVGDLHAARRRVERRPTAGRSRR